MENCCINPGSVSRLSGSAHRWVELYAGGVQRKTTKSQTNCSSIGNNPHAVLLRSQRAGGGLLLNGLEHDRNGAGPCRWRRLVAVSVLFGLFRVPPNATGTKQMHRAGCMRAQNVAIWFVRVALPGLMG